MTKEQALHQFWSSFGIPAYDASTVPQKVEIDGTLVDLKPPYITYDIATGYLGDFILLSASIWDRSTSWLFVSDKAEEISREIGFAGKTLHYEGGYIRLHRSSPFSQRVADEDETIRRVYLNVTAEFIAV